VVQKSKPLPNDQKIVLKPVNEIRILCQIKVWIKHYNQWWSQGHKVKSKDSTLKAEANVSTLNAKAKDSTLETKDFKIVLEDPRGRGLVLEDSNTGKHRIKCFGEAPNTLHIYSVISNGQNSKLLLLKSFVQNMQWLVKSVSSSFSKDLSDEAKAKDSALEAKTKDFKIVLEDPWGRRLVLEDSNTDHNICWH